jgi:lysozyme
MINATVGIGGANAPDDVREIQRLLNARANAGLAEDGVIGPATIAAIKQFQATLPGVAVPDGRIDPGGPTDAALVGGAAAAGKPVQPAFPGAAVMVVDLSHYNGAVSVAQFLALRAAGVGAVILKASEGTDVPDNSFTARLANARAAGLLLGAYHFGSPGDVAAQVDHFCAQVAAGGGAFDEVVSALDVEKNDPMTPNQAEAWVAAFRGRTGATPFIYGGGDWLGAQGGANGRPNLAGCPLWYSMYPFSAKARPQTPLFGWADWTLWQYTDGSDPRVAYAATVAGVASDRSVFRGGLDDLRTLWGRLLAPGG